MKNLSAMYLDKNIFVLLVIMESLGLQIRASVGRLLWNHNN